jgi:membrane fusion protein, heavy metal efflux system
MSNPSPRRPFFRSRLALGAIAILVVVALATVGYWLPRAKQLIASRTHASESASDKHDTHAEKGHDEHAGEKPGAHEGEKPGAHEGEESDEHEGEKHDAHAGEEPDAHAGESPEEHAKHAGEAPDAHKATKHEHNEATSVALSREAQANVGIQTTKVELKPFERTITVPAMIVEQPGRSRVQIAAPLTGVVTHIYPTQGEAVAPGQPLFDLRLTHEEVVEAQGAFLQTAEELDVVGREITRLEQVTAEGAVAGKQLLERKYEQQKLNATLRSQRQRLLLHGLSASQVDRILAKRKLLSEMTVFVPMPAAASNKTAPTLQVEKLIVDQGQHVKAGDLLCLLADYSELCVQGKAFEQDMPALDHAANLDWRVTAVIPSNDRQRQTVPNLKIVSLANTVDTDSRAFLFFVQLPNKLIRDRTTEDGRRFCAWQFKPGQRVELQVPVERWNDRIVLPRDAVVQDGAESYVFEKVDNHFDRRPVRVVYRDQYSAVLDAGGAIKPGQTVVIASAYRIHQAMKNKAGGAPDPHAGHNH